MRILLVEDDALLGEGIKTALTHFTYNVDWFMHGKAALSAIKSTEYSLIILDLGLPDIDGLHVLRSIRQQSINIPVLILTAREQIDDKILGLDTGADDYMIKPFDVKELEARIRTLTRRHNGRRTNTIHIGRACLNTHHRTLAIDSKVIEFSRREYSLINAFFERPRQVLSREYLESTAYSWDEEIESNSLEVHIHHLRKKIGNDAIKTVRGVGYVIVEGYFE